jgi:hypothetical protein
MSLCSTQTEPSFSKEAASAMVPRNRQKMLKRVTLTVDPDDYAAMEHLAQRSEVSVSWLIRRAVREFLQLHQNEAKIVLPLLDKNTP